MADSGQNRVTRNPEQTTHLLVHQLNQLVIRLRLSRPATIMDGTSKQHEIFRATAVKLPVYPGARIEYFGFRCRNNKAKSIQRMWNLPCRVSQVNQRTG